MTNATLVSMALMFAVLLVWLGIGRVSSYLPRLLEYYDARQAERLLGGLLFFTLLLAVLAALATALLFGEQRGLRLAQLAFVLGAGTIAVLAGLIFWLPWRAGLDRPLPGLLALLIAPPLGFYFLPYRNFEQVFAPDQSLLGAGAGVLAIAVTCLVLWSMRRAIRMQQPQSA